METYKQREMNAKADLNLVVKKFEKKASNVQKKMTSAPSRPVRHNVIKKMIGDIKRFVDDPKMNLLSRRKKLKAHYKKVMLKWYIPIFWKEPRLETIICRNKELVLSCFTEYSLPCWSLNKNDDERLNDLKYVIEFCGYNLTSLNVDKHPFSTVMPLINNNCPGLKELVVEFKEIKDEDFENVFSNMPKLEKLEVTWKCKNSALPMTLVKSLEQVGGTLKQLYLSCRSEDEVFLPDSLASVFTRFIALERLYVNGFQLSQPIIQSIGEIKNLTSFKLLPLRDHPMINKKISMSPIGNLINLESLDICWDCGDADELLINLGDNAKQLQKLDMLVTNLTDNGMIAVKKMSQLRWLTLGKRLDTLKKTNNFITDKSIECLFNEKLRYLNLSNCTEISNRSVIKAFENLPDLSCLCVKNTNVTIKVVEELSKLTKLRKQKLHVYVSFKDCNGIFKSLIESHNVELISTE
ncbi:uncharacterized protein LOC122853381 [Aphidius gifuensis]|uniref:uncharacterized protein LOC122853381 n=1 Tax=Aphidius gifuensis TaxID=684658 RepID=UPI001CDC684A|nr:uncharacterized protein LOC122853381 [Aphidius gifuensis]